MKKTMRLLPLLLAVLTMAACKNSKGEYEVNYFAFQTESEGDWGMMGTDGKVLFEEEFENTPGPAINGRFYVLEDDNWSIYAAESRPRKIGEYQDVGCFTIGLCPVVDFNNDMLYIDKEGNTAFKLKKVNGKKVVYAYAFYNGRAMIKLENNKYGYIDQEGNVAIPCRYEDAWSFNDGVALVYIDSSDDENGKWGVVDTEGNTLFTKKFKDMTPITYKFSEGVMSVQANEKLAIIDKTGKVLHRVKGSQAEDVHNGHFVFYDGDSEKYGLMNVEGQVVIRPRYSTLMYNGAFLLGSTDDERFNLLTLTGEKIAKMPKGYPTLLEDYYDNYDKVFFVGNYGEGYKMFGPDGQRIPLSADINSLNTTFFTLAIARSDDDEEYDEPDYYDEPDNEDVPIYDQPAYDEPSDL